MGELMTNDQWVRLLVFAFGTIVVGGSLGELWYGPRRGMTWAQFLRFLGLAIVMSTILVAQYMHRAVPITGYTVSFGLGAAVGALGVWPRFRTPMLSQRRPRS